MFCSDGSMVFAERTKEAGVDIGVYFFSQAIVMVANTAATP